MEILNYIITYLVIGVTMSFCFDLWLEAFMSKMKEEITDFDWGWMERFFVILLWPYAIFLLIKGIIK